MATSSKKKTNEGHPPIRLAPREPNPPYDLAAEDRWYVREWSLKMLEARKLVFVRTDGDNKFQRFRYATWQDLVFETNDVANSVGLLVTVPTQELIHTDNPIPVGDGTHTNWYVRANFVITDTETGHREDGFADVPMCPEKSNKADRATGSARSYAVKYGLMNIFQIAPGKGDPGYKDRAPEDSNTPEDDHEPGSVDGRDDRPRNAQKKRGKAPKFVPGKRAKPAEPGPFIVNEEDVANLLRESRDASLAERKNALFIAAAKCGTSAFQILKDRVGLLKGTEEELAEALDIISTSIEGRDNEESCNKLL